MILPHGLDVRAIVAQRPGLRAPGAEGPTQREEIDAWAAGQRKSAAAGVTSLAASILLVGGLLWAIRKF